MPQLARTRTGWENEHLATHLLSRIAFVAKPITVSDDIGSDFFCVLFEKRNDTGIEMLFPLNSFAIQVKSSDGVHDATKNITHLHKLELPFFLGIVSRNDSEMKIYSGEHLPFLFAHKGNLEKLRFSPCENAENESDGYVGNDGDYRLTMPLVTKLSINGTEEEILKIGLKLRELCSRMQRNISSKINDEYIFEYANPSVLKIFAGCGSYPKFRGNFMRRLAEVFYNLSWVFDHRHADFQLREFEIYERCYLDLKQNCNAAATIADEPYKELKAKLGKIG